MSDLQPSTLKQIPIVDGREGGPIHHAQVAGDRARILRDAILEWFPSFTRTLLPFLDFIARRWLIRSQSPYSDEVRAISNTLGISGIWFLNSSYQWFCTAIARDDQNLPWIARTLDWHFPGMGQSVEVLQMRGSAGEFYNVTWPGYVGTLTALAPGRFCAAINQAPLRRRTRHPRLRPLDIAINATLTLVRSNAIPPDQLLRLVFETARSYDEAKHLLETTPIARPTIYTLAGVTSGQRCIIERTEFDGRTRYDEFGAANDWLDRMPGWEARVESVNMLTASFDDAAQNSALRCAQLSKWRGSFEQETLGWVVPPVLNVNTRLAVEMCPARGILNVIGYEWKAGAPTAEPVTSICEIRSSQMAA